MAIAGSFLTLDSTEGMDKITQTEKVTSAYFTDGTTTLAAASVQTSSLSDTNEEFFFGISNTNSPTVEEFNVAFGSSTGYGNAKFSSDSSAKSKAEAVYKQYASLLLAPTEVTGGFFISRNNSLSTVPTSPAIASGKDTDIFVLSAKRTNMKDRLNKGTFTIALSGSNTTGDGATLLELTDDSVNSKAVATVAGDRFNIVSGSAGTVVKAASEKTYGFFYPDQGLIVLSQQELSASIPGVGANKDDVVIFDNANHKGFGIGTGTGGTDKKIAMRFVNCLKPTGAKLVFRAEEDQVSAQYFCRIRSGEMNFSNNPTFISGSQNELRHSSMIGNPTTFISGVQLYNAAGDMVAVGRLSTPLKKTFTSEATIKVKLTF